MRITFDGASANRRFLSLHGTTAKNIVHKVMNRYASDGRYLYYSLFIPSTFNKNNTELFSFCCKMYASKLCPSVVIIIEQRKTHFFQTHSRCLYQDKANCLGLSLLPKIKLEHIQLTSFSKMRVDFAAQVCTCLASAKYDRCCIL